MAQNLQLVFSDPGEGVSDEEFDAWYEAHLKEILSIPGFKAAQRYRLAAAGEGGPDVPARRVVVYEVDREPAALQAEMARMGLISADSYAELKKTATDPPPLPAWWSQVRFASWYFFPIGERVEALD